MQSAEEMLRRFSDSDPKVKNQRNIELGFFDDDEECQEVLKQIKEAEKDSKRKSEDEG